MEEKKIYFLHNEDGDWDEDIPFKLSKKEKNLIEWFLSIADIDNMYFMEFNSTNCYEFKD